MLVKTSALYFRLLWGSSSPAPWLTMAPKRNLPPRRASAKAKAKALALRISTSNSRRDRRRDACRGLNHLANEVGVGQAAVDAKGATGAEVDALIRLLEKRLLSDGQLERLRGAAKAFADNGGELSAEVVSEASSTSPALPKHRVLASFFKLKSKAFMLTYNSRGISPATWGPFQKFVVDLARTWGARAWAACLEKSLHSETPDLHHLHAYLLWTDSIGIETRSLDAFYFQDVRPRVDVCTTRAATTSPMSAGLHGLWYVALYKDGTVKADTNFAAGQMYKPRAVWLQGLFEAGKLRHEEYLRMSATWFPVGPP